ncbi:hypothetical protein LINPERPRIM_LOCUS24852 [Linum perenne]
MNQTQFYQNQFFQQKRTRGSISNSKPLMKHLVSTLNLRLIRSFRPDSSS